MRSPTPVPGSLVWLRQRRWRVERARLDRNVVCLDVAHQQQRLTVLAPFDRPHVLIPDERAIVVRRQQARARLNALRGTAYGVRDIRAAIDARIDPMPHQFEPVLAVLRGQRRMLIADEVGLGKTIQAGLIIAELRLRRPALRALIVTPAGLRAQWADELHHRFCIDVRSAEAELSGGSTHLPLDGRDPWIQPGVWMVSIDYLKQRHVMDGLPASAWDVVVVDEAHAAAGTSDRHDACDELGRRARHFILLSATPHTGDEPRFRRLLQMGALPYASDSLDVFRRTREQVPLPQRRRIRWKQVVPSEAVAQLLDALMQFERVMLARARHSRRDAALLLLAVFRKRALSTVHAFDRTVARRLEWLDTTDRRSAFDWLHQPLLDFGDDEVSDEERSALSADVGLPVAHERTWLRRLRTLAAAALRAERKIEVLKRLLARTHDAAIVFTEFRDSLVHLERTLAGLRTLAVLHGGQPEAVRQQELSRFLRGDASLLIATDAGGQGLNLQSRARWVINLELPWNPIRLEQRIGRVDRVGQKRGVHATLLLTAHPAEGALLTALARRTMAVKRVMRGSALEEWFPSSQLAVAAALFDRAPLPESSPVARALPLTIAHRLTGRAVARITTRRRKLLRHWRSPFDIRGRPVAPRPSCRAWAAAVIYSIATLDGTGAVVERRVIAVVADESGAAALRGRGTSSATEAMLASRVQRRLERLRLQLADDADRRLESERAIALHLHALRYPEEAQLGLFSQRERRAFDQARAAAALSASDAADRITDEAARLRLELASPKIEWIARRR